MMVAGVSWEWMVGDVAGRGRVGGWCEGGRGVVCHLSGEGMGNSTN